MKFRGTFKSVFFFSIISISILGIIYAGSDTANLGVSATVVDNLRIQSVTDVAFGDYDPTSSTATDAATTGAVSVKGTKGMTYTIYIDGDRTMSLGDDDLAYVLSQDASHSTAWPSDSGSASSFTSSSNAVKSHTIYGKINAEQDVPQGSYTDSATITINW